jgi:hypothetical protein
MSTADIYRTNADNQRAAAAAATLANRCEMHERSAMAWDEMAQSLEDTAKLAVVNAAAKAERKDA